MNKICTSLEQSQKLIELGIDVNTADMDYIQFANNPKEYDCVVNVWNNEHEEDWIPAWSLAALINALPSGKALIHDKSSHGYKCICKNIDTNLYNNPIDACYEMIIKLNELKML